MHRTLGGKAAVGYGPVRKERMATHTRTRPSIVYGLPRINRFEGAKIEQPESGGKD